ncbi:MAG: HlyD family secretion protein [Salaquimonas sp.]|nr:HlyD family secretion protein [Salaquimonas sp.]
MNVHNKPADLDETSQDAAKPARRRLLSMRTLLMVSLPLVLAIGGGAYWLASGRYIETENAYVEQAKILISSDVSGRIVEVDVGENQFVHKGDTLFRIDPEPYRIAVASAEATLAQARLKVEQLKISYLTAKAKLAAAEETLDIRKRGLKRNDDLTDRGYSSQANLDQLRLSYQTAQEAVMLARQEIDATKAALSGRPAMSVDSHPEVRSALAKLDDARLDLQRTTIKAPADGVVSQTEKLNVGQYAGSGSAMLTLVETGQVWVEANLKETKLSGIRPGQHAEVTVDALPGVSFSAQVESIGAGTGSEFSLIPAQNATGNWVKVVQRLPVRVKIDATDTSALRTGMSAFVSIDTGKARWQEYFE